MLTGAAALAATALAVPGEAFAEEPVQRIMLIRHAEKPTSAGAPYGITAQGIRDDHALIVDGWTRAGALVELFAPSDGRMRLGLSRPAHVFATLPGKANESLRPMQTVTPLAQRLGMRVDTAFAFGEERQLAKHLLKTPGVMLTAWQHQHIPLIVRELGFEHLGVPAIWPGDRFDMVFVFTRTASTWTFAQIPQLLLAGDRATPFTNASNSGSDD